MGKSKKHGSKSKKKLKHKERKEKKQKSKKHSKVKKKDNNEKPKREKGVTKTDEKLNNDFSIPVELMSNKSHAPETPEEYKKRQSHIRREIDPLTGRSRLIKGDGEVLEEIVSKERHIEINKEATKGDGDFFQDIVLSKRQ